MGCSESELDAGLYPQGFFMPQFTQPYIGGQQAFLPQPTPVTFGAFSSSDQDSSRYFSNSLSNPYGAGSVYKVDGLMNPYSQFGSKYSNDSWTNKYATNAPKIYDSEGNYHGRLSSNKYDADSTSNPYGRYGSKYSSDSINNPYGAGSKYGDTLYVYPAN